jgi:hypothetical protein
MQIGLTILFPEVAMRTLLSLLLIAAPALAQYPVGANALRWIGTTSTVGPFCWGFSCTPVSATVTAGETGTLFVRSEQGDAYAIGLSLSASRCLTVPGFLNQLVLDDPFSLWQIGICSTPSPILACPSGYDNIAVTIPPFFPAGLQFSLQGATGSIGPYSFTQAIQFTVR